MNTRTWRIIPQFYQPFWDPEDEVLIWDSGDVLNLELHHELPGYIRTAKDAQQFLHLSSLKNVGAYCTNWLVVEN